MTDTDRLNDLRSIPVIGADTPEWADAAIRWGVAEIERLRAKETEVKDAIRTTAAEVVRMLAGWGDDGLTQDELYWLAGRIAAFEGGMCDLCQHVCPPQCPLYPLNDEAQEIEAGKETRG